MKRSRIGAILFDKDGTLIEFEATWYPIVRRVLSEMGDSLGIPAEVLLALAEASGIGPGGFAKESLIQSATTSGIVAYWEGILAGRGFRIRAGRLAAIFEEASTGREAEPRLVPGVQGLLARLRSRGIRLGVATSDTRASTVHGLSRAGILDSFDFIAADGDGFPAKPDPGAALAFRRLLGLPEGSLAVIGDSYGDLVFARRSKARFIGMRTDCNEFWRFIQAGFPVVRDFSDLEGMEALLA